MLEIRFRSIDLWLPIAGQSLRARGVGVRPEDASFIRDRVLWLDINRKTIEYAPGVVVPAKPFWGDIGVAPPKEKGRWPAACPDIHGGNQDNRDLVAGTTLYLPVHVPGALLAIGDGHAAQGNGEVAVSAVETSLRGEIQVVLHKGVRLERPRAETPTHWISMALHADLDEAIKIATRDMIEFIVRTKKLDLADAYMVASASMDLAVTQAVDCVKGVHALMPKAVFQP
jgi:acetamidase/formamidase